jgi:hypothetical protein
MKRMSEEINGTFVQAEGEKVHQDNISVRLKDEANASLDTLLKLRDNAGSERVRQLSAIEILDRAGYKPSDKIEGEITIDASDGLVNALKTAMEKVQLKLTPSDLDKARLHVKFAERRAEEMVEMKRPIPRELSR